MRVQSKSEFFGSISIDEFNTKRELTVNSDTYEVLEMLDKKITIGQCADMLSRKYEIDKVAMYETINLILDDFTENGMISLHDSPPAGEKRQVPDCLRLKHDFFLKSAAINLLSKCNLECRHCYGEYGITRNEILEKETVFSILDQMKELQCREISFTGGEIFLYPGQGVFDILEYARQRNFKISLMTNGTLFTPEIVKKLEKIGHMEIQISIDSTNAEIHDLFRGVKGSFKKSLRGLKMLKEAGFTMELAFVIHKKNCDSIQAIHELAAELGIKLHLGPLFKYGNAVKCLDDYYLEPSSYYDVYKTVRKNQAKIDKGTGNPGDKEAPNGKYLERCDAGARTIAIKANGDVYPCEIFPQEDKFIMGNIYKGRLADIVYNFDREKSIADFNALNLAKCKSCQLVTKCTGGCMSIAYAESGSLNEPDPFSCAKHSALEGKSMQDLFFYTSAQPGEVGSSKD
jgi:radical SAM protein with 4Fe4S-binding SPASM domain